MNETRFQSAVSNSRPRGVRVIEAYSPITIGDAELPVRSMPSAELAAARIWIGNWERMLPAITSCRPQMTPSFLRSILKFVSEPMQLSRIEQEFVTGDPTLVRAAIFNLLHAGNLQAPQLHTEQLSFLTCFQPVRPCHESSPR